MPDYFRHDLRGIDPPDVAVGGLRGGRPANSGRVHAVLSGLDRIPATGRRVVGAVSCGDAQGWPQDGYTPLFSEHGSPVWKTVLRTRFDLSPGHVPVVTMVYLNGGITSQGDTPDTPPYAEMRCTSRWWDYTNKTSSPGETVVRNAVIPSGHAVPVNLWSGIRIARFPIADPGSSLGLDQTESIADWSRETHVEIEIAMRGGIRIVDMVITEQPRDIGFEASDPDNTVTSGAFAPQSPDGQYPDLRSPYTAMATANPRGGSHRMLDQCHAQLRRIGPILLAWHGYRAETDTAAATTDPGWIPLINSAVPTRWARLHGLVTSAIPNPPETLSGFGNTGLAAGTGGYAARPGDASGERRSIPVRVWARMRFTNTSTTNRVKMRVYGGAETYVTFEWENPGAGAHWFTGYGHLEVGQGPGDDVALDVYSVRTNGSGFVEIQTLIIHRADNWQTPADGVQPWGSSAAMVP